MIRKYRFVIIFSHYGIFKHFKMIFRLITFMNYIIKKWGTHFP